MTMHKVPAGIILLCVVSLVTLINNHRIETVLRPIATEVTAPTTYIKSTTPSFLKNQTFDTLSIEQQVYTIEQVLKSSSIFANNKNNNNASSVVVVEVNNASPVPSVSVRMRRKTEQQEKEEQEKVQQEKEQQEKEKQEKEQQEKEQQEKEEQLKQKEQQIKQKESQFEQKEKELQKKEKELQKKEKELQKKEQQIQEKEQKIQEKEQQIQEEQQKDQQQQQQQQETRQDQELQSELLQRRKECKKSDAAAAVATRGQGLCQQLLNFSKSPPSLWRDAFWNIVDASIAPQDSKKEHYLWSEALLKLVPPMLLERSLLARLPASQLQHIVETIDLKLKHPTDNNIPPLIIAVNGGSVAEGSGCNNLPDEVYAVFGKDTGAGASLRGKSCAWPIRVQWLADHFLGPGIVRVENIAVGGTNSWLASPTLEYRMYPEGSLLKQFGPDIIVNGYSVNDNLPPWGLTVNSTETRQHFNDAMARGLVYTNAALQSQPCTNRTPAVIFVDEYFGNQNELLLGEDIRNNAVRVIQRQYPSIGYVSSASMVKHAFVYTNEPETFFSPNWWKGNFVKRKTEPHFGMPGHQLLAYAIGYASLRSVYDHCEINDVARNPSSSRTSNQKEEQKQYSTSMPPHIHDHLTFADRNDPEHELKRLEKERAFCESADHLAPPCPFAFVATPAGTVTRANRLNDYIRPFTLLNEGGGWKGQDDIRNGWQNKLGLVSHTNGARVRFRVPQITNLIRHISIQYLRSYGEKWANSTAQFDLAIYSPTTDAAKTTTASTYTNTTTNRRKHRTLVLHKNTSSSRARSRNLAISNEPTLHLTHERSFQLEGIHDQAVSIAYEHKVDLKDDMAKIGDTVELTITLVGGSEFKIISLLLCSR